MNCPTHPDEELEFVADMSAPGSGRVWKCPQTQKEFVQSHGVLIDPEELPQDEEPPWVMRIEDCI